MIKGFITTILSGMLLSIASCDDVLERNIAKEDVVLQTPSNGYVDTLGQGQTLRWEYLEGAVKYRVFIIATDSNRIALDTVITKNQFTVALPVGEYNWCIKGINGAYETNYVCRNIFVGKEFSGEKNISGDTIALQSPFDKDTVTVDDQQTFRWDNLTGTSKYELLIILKNNLDEVTIALDTIVTGNQVQTIVSEGSNEWCVKGINSKYETKYNCRSLVVTD